MINTITILEAVMLVLLTRRNYEVRRFDNVRGYDADVMFNDVQFWLKEYLRCYHSNLRVCNVRIKVGRNSYEGFVSEDPTQLMTSFETHM
jgi:hypothetical protein